MEPLTIFGALVGATKVTKEVTDVLSRITSATLDAPEAVEKVRLEVDAMQMHLDMLNMHITAKSAANLRTPSQLIIEDFRIVMEGCVRTLDKLRSLVAPMVYPGSGMSPSLIQLLRANWSKTEQARYYINHLHRLQQCLNCVLTILNGSTRSIGEVRRAAQYLQQNAYQVKLDMHASPIGTHVVLPDEPVTPSLGDDAPLARQRTPEEDEALDVVSDEVAEDPNSAVVTAMGMGGLGVSGPIVVDPHPEDDYAFIYGPEDSNVSHGGTESGETSASGAAAAAEPGDAAAPVQPHRHRPLPPSYAALGFRRAIYKDTSICLWNPNSVAAIAGVVLPLTRTRLENPFHYRFGHIEHVRPGVRQRITRRFRLHRQRRVVRPAAQEAVGAAAQNPAPPPAGAAEAPATPAFTASTPTPAPAAEPIDMSGVLIPVSPENPPSEAMLEPLPSVEDAAGPGGT